MGAMSLKEKAVLAGLGVLLLYALTIGWWFLGSSKRTAAENKFNAAVSKVQRERSIIAESVLWDELYETEASLIPVIEDNQGSDTVWMNVIGEIASSNHVFISEYKPGKEDYEEWSGDMQKISVDIRWTAAVESLVRFMYELQNTDKGKFDVQSLNFSSQSKRVGFMNGHMTLVCIFKRSED